ncbi:putative ABC transport system ATP-binding protein [Methanolobus vulcani]|jgi:putative ABC transport system ATP-binding protein|uniref:Putative ABC transport system ATP-binding protein n=1 Tax=Methanolobus vulcani TaxID=38026 RepID=A0A7Z7FC75_9EURY|nr:ABC transporter ATP-binding protein [Methanolobus vulcani]MDK2826748.1 putative transport system ATP-binding protein [Methanolobus sp.]MDK2948144.1 putative transport system ATP-binding protein [Methanolobus sp.]SDF69235.1 putative ABC transport system ATP-binding protein [Methanolobus vulcani]
MDAKAAYDEKNREYTPVIELVNICKSYHVGDMDVPILKSIDLKVMPGEFVAIMGPSGSGKSTLMNMIGCLDRPNCGQVLLMGKDVDTLSDPELAKLRGMEIGFVFQNFNLVPRLTTLQNVELPTYANKKAGVDTRKKAKELVEMVGLKDRMNYKPSEMSGGQQQRVAIARALINDPSLILADEPTGNLDSKTGDEIMKIFSNLHEKGRTIVMITHDPDLTEYADRVVHLKDGIIDNN